MKNAAPLRLLSSLHHNRKSAEFFGSDDDVASDGDFLNLRPVAGGDAALGPVPSDSGRNTEKSGEPAVASESANHLEVRLHDGPELGTFGSIVKRNLVPSQISRSPSDQWESARNVPRIPPMRTGRPPSPPSKQELMIRIGTRLRWVREAHGKSQAEMGAIFGVSSNAWGKWELGQRLPDRFKLPVLVARLGISMEYLTGNSLEGVERSLAIQLAAAHPELAQQTSISPSRDTDPA